MDGPLAFLMQNQRGADLRVLKGMCVFLAAGVFCRFGSLGRALGKKGIWEWLPPQKVPVAGQHPCSHGGSRCGLPVCTRDESGSSGAPGGGEGRALQVGTMSEQTLNYCY